MFLSLVALAALASSGAKSHGDVLGVAAQPFDDFAKRRDPAAIERLASPDLHNAFRFLRVSGAFGGGSKGWNAEQLQLKPDGPSYVVFTTPLTVQDYGDRIFKSENGFLTQLMGEDEEFGVRIDHHEFDITLTPDQKKASFVDRIHLRKVGATDSTFFMRTGQNYRVRSISDGTNEVPFRQAGGVVLLPTFEGDQTVYTVEYDGLVDHSEYAGATEKDEMMLTGDYWWLNIGRRPATYTARVVAPKGWTIIGQGEPIEQRESGSYNVARFAMNLPVSYYSLAAGTFQTVEKQVDGITYHVWSRSMSESDMVVQLDMMPGVVKFFSRFKLYPFKHYGADVSDAFGGGALEAYSFATYGPYSTDDFVHETSHTWFGGIVPNTYLHSYWNESFANFCDNFYERYAPIGDARDRLAAFRLEATAAPTYKLGTCDATGANTGPEASDLGYGKGSRVLQQLEIEMGSDALTRAIKRFATNHETGVKGEWDEFESACGPDWRWFFDQWLRRAGAPAFEFSDVQWNGQAVTGKVTFSGQPYRIRAEVWVETQGKGELKAVDLNLSGSDQTSTFSLELPEKPDRVTIDPFDVILTIRDANSKVMAVQREIPLFQAYVDPNYASWGDRYNDARFSQPPSDLNHTLLIGHPNTMPALRPLMAKAGFTVSDDILTFKGHHIDLNEGAALALVDLGNGRQCGILIGTTKRKPKTGLAKVAVVDEYGRFLAGQTEPRHSGRWSYQL